MPVLSWTLWLTAPGEMWSGAAQALKVCWGLNSNCWHSKRISLLCSLLAFQIETSLKSEPYKEVIVFVSNLFVSSAFQMKCDPSKDVSSRQDLSYSVTMEIKLLIFLWRLRLFVCKPPISSLVFADSIILNFFYLFNCTLNYLRKVCLFRDFCFTVQLKKNNRFLKIERRYSKNKKTA